MKNKVKKIKRCLIFIIFVIFISTVSFSVSATTSSLTVMSCTNWKGDVPYSYNGYKEDVAGSLDNMHYYTLINGSSEFVLRFNIPKTVYRGDRFVFTGEIIVEDNVRIFEPDCSFNHTLQLTNSHFIDEETTVGFYKYNFIISLVVPQDYTEFDCKVTIVSNGIMNGFYIKDLSYSLNNDVSVSINDNSDKNANNIMNNQNQNAQNIQQNQNENTDKIIQNQEENQDEIKNGWQQSESPDTTITDDYVEQDAALQESTAAGRSETVSIFNNFGALFQSEGHLYRGLLSVTAIFSELTKIEWIGSLLNFSLALGVFAFVIGTSVHVFRSAHERPDSKKEISKSEQGD